VKKNWLLEDEIFFFDSTFLTAGGSVTGMNTSSSQTELVQSWGLGHSSRGAWVVDGSLGPHGRINVPHDSLANHVRRTFSSWYLIYKFTTSVRDGARVRYRRTTGPGPAKTGRSVCPALRFLGFGDRIRRVR